MATIVTRQENPLSAFLLPINQVIHYVLQNKLDEKRGTRDTERSILTQALTDPNISKYLSSAEAVPLLQELGLDKSPEIQALIKQGTESLGPMARPKEALQVEAVPTGMPGPAPSVLPSVSRVEGPPDIRKPGVKQIRDQIVSEESARTLATKQAEANIEASKQIYVELKKKAIEAGMYTPEIDAAIQDAFETRVPGFKRKLTIDDKGHKSLTIEEEDRGAGASSVRPAILNLESYSNGVTAAFDDRTKGVQATQAIIAGDAQAVQTFLEKSGASAEVVAAIQMATQANKKGAKTLEPVDRAKLLLASINQAIEKKNKANAQVGQLIGKGKDEILSDMVEPLTFEEIAGKTEAEYRAGATAAPGPDAAKAAAEAAAAKVKPGPTVAQPQPSASKVSSEEDKVQGAYTALTEQLLKRLSANKLLKKDMLITASFAPNMKQGLMAKYGLNQKQLDELEKRVRAGLK